MTAPAPQPTRLPWVVTFVAVLAAAAPHFFFAPPLQLHMDGQLQAWLGIAIWAPAILAGVGFFFGVEFGRRGDGPYASTPPATRTAVLLLALLGYLLLAAVLHEPRWTGMQALRPWGELRAALPLFAALGALRAIFWQGFVQDRVLGQHSVGARSAALLAMEVAVAAPFLLSGEPAIVAAGLLPLVAAEALAAALAFELGFTVRGVMAVRAAIGAAFVWFQQALLL